RRSDSASASPLVLSLATGVAVERAERAPRANAHDGPPVVMQYRDIALPRYKTPALNCTYSPAS
ncbi:MAG TPA: hypothetical protein VKJ77_16330, partial [Caballeronia sp.]|nr:hypothetical protein [Caballeronia sp.]